MIDAGRFLGAFGGLGTRLRLAPGRFEYFIFMLALRLELMLCSSSNRLVTVTACGAASSFSFVVAANVGYEREAGRSEGRSVVERCTGSPVNPT